MNFRHFKTIRDIPREGWDRLSGGNISASYGWLRTAEETAQPPVSPLYIVLEYEGIAQAAVVCQFLADQTSGIMLDGVLFGRLLPLARRLGISLGPTLLCNPFRNRGEPLFLLAKGLTAADRNRCITLLLNHLETYGRRHGLSTCFAPVTDGELASLLRANGYQQTVYYPVAHIDITFASFQGYLDHVGTISRNGRDTVKNERNRNRRAGVIIELLSDPEQYGSALYDLVDRHYRRLNGSSFPYRADFFAVLKRNMGEDAAIYAAFKQGKLIGVTVWVSRGEASWLPIIGIDHETAGNDFTYFNMAYYRPIEDAIGLGLKKLYYGNLLYDLKRKRGCAVSPTYLYYRPRTSMGRVAATLWFQLHARWFQRKFPAWIWEQQTSARQRMMQDGSVSGAAQR